LSEITSAVLADVLMDAMDRSGLGERLEAMIEGKANESEFTIGLADGRVFVVGRDRERGMTATSVCRATDAAGR
jgi:hypothetical protein